MYSRARFHTHTWRHTRTQRPPRPHGSTALKAVDVASPKHFLLRDEAPAPQLRRPGPRLPPAGEGAARRGTRRPSLGQGHRRPAHACWRTPRPPRLGLLSVSRSVTRKAPVWTCAGRAAVQDGGARRVSVLRGLPSVSERPPLPPPRGGERPRGPLGPACLLPGDVGLSSHACRCVPLAKYLLGASARFHRSLARCLGLWSAPLRRRPPVLRRAASFSAPCLLKRSFGQFFLSDVRVGVWWL